VSGKGTLVRATIPYPLIWDSGALEILVEDKIFEVRFERRYRQEGDAPVTGGRIIAAPHQEWLQDRLGRVAYTALAIQFPIYVPYYDMGERDEELKRWVLTVINRLLDVYRYATGESHINRIPRIELQVDSISRALKGDETLEEQNRETLIGLDIGGPNRWLTQARTEPITEEARQLLQEGTEPPIPTVLHLNAKREYVFENYRIVVVEAETAFEALVDEVVAQHYRSQGLSKVQVDKKMEAGLQGLINDHLPRCCRRPFVGTPEHAAWVSDLYQLRNEVVHDGVSVDASQARRALDATEQALSWIRREQNRN
jgi:hypothetical protein